MANELKEQEWFLSGGNGVITLAESGSTEPITYLRPEQKANAGYIVERHNATIRSIRAEVERLRASQFSMEVIECDKCDLCEDHHG